MAAFNLTAQLNLVGPTNVRQIVGDIRKQLGTIKGNIDLGIDPKAIRTIAQLQSQASQISSSLNNVSRSASVATGSINDLNNAASKNQLGSVAQSAAKTANAANDLGKESSRSSKEVKVLSNELAEFGRQSGLAIRRFAAFSLVSGVMYKLNSAINQALSQYIEFDRELVRVSQVTGKSVSELDSLVKEISSLASSTGVASKELIQVSSTLAQAGLSARDAEKALKALALSANAPSFDNLNDTVEGSIALMRQFGISANDLESALGSINAVAAAFAVEASDLIAAIQRTGGVFASASRGVSEGTDALNEFIAVFTSVRATTRESAETIATGLRTIFTRIQRESTITALRELGVELRDVEGKFVGPYEAVRRLSAGLGQLDPRSQTFAAIVEELGGFRQIGKVIPLIQQFATAEAALNVAMKGGDSLAEANRQAQQALAVQLAKTREEFVALVRDFANNSVFRGFLTTTISITKSILSLARAGRSLFPLLTIMGGFKAFSAVTQFAGGFMQGVRPSGGKGGGGNEEGIDNKSLSRSMGRSVSRSIGKGLGEILSGSKTERQADSLEQIVSILRSNAQAFNTDISSLSQPITSLSSSLNDNNSLLSANTSGLNNVYAALVNLESTISNINFGGGGGPTTVKDGGRILGFAKGGTVPGSGKGDKIPALLEPGEVVMSNRAVKQYGRGNLVRMNIGGGAKGPILVDRNDVNTQASHVGKNFGPLIQDEVTAYANLPVGRGQRSKKFDPEQTRVAGLSASETFKLGLPTIVNQNIKSDKPGVDSESLIDWIRHNPDLLFMGKRNIRPSALTVDPQVFADAFADAITSQNASVVRDADISKAFEQVKPLLDPKYLASKKDKVDLFSSQRSTTGSSQIRHEGFDLRKIRKSAIGGRIQRFVKGGVTQRNVGYIDYDVIANPANQAIVTKGMEATGQKGPRLYSDYLTQLAVKARKESSLQKLRAVYGVAGSGKTTLARGQGTDDAKLRKTNRFPILTPEDIQKANEVLILSSTVSKDKLDSFFGEVDRAYTLSSTTAAEKEKIKAQRASRDVTGVGLEGRTPGGTMGVGKDTAVGEALLQDRLGDRSVVLGRSESGKLRRKSGNELVEIIKKKIGYTWGGFAPMTAGHESILDAAAAKGISPEDFIFLVGTDEGINDADASSYRTAIFNQDARVLLAKAGAGAKGATVLPKARDFETPLGFDVSEESGRRKVVLPSKGSKVFVGEEKGANLTAKYKDAGYDVVSMARTEGISATKVRELIEKGDLGGLQSLLSPGVYDLISNNIGRIQNRARVLPDIIAQVKQNQAVKIGDIEKSIQALGISRIDKKKLSDPEYAAKVQILEELRSQRDKIKSAAAFEPYKLLDELARSQPDTYGLDFSAGAAPTAKPIRTVGTTQKASIGGLIQKFMAGGEAEETAPWGDTATVPEILQLLGFDKAQQIGRIEDPRTLLKKRTPTEDEKAKIKAIRDEATKTYNRRIGAAKGVQTRAAGQGLKFAAAGMFGDAFPDETYDAQGTKGTRKVVITAGVMDETLAKQLDAQFGGGIESLAQQAAETAMISNITKGLVGGKQAELDFDRTLAVGADDIGSLKDFRDPTVVAEKLKSATLTRLGESLVDLVKAHPELTSNMRVVTARSQSTVPLIQQWLASKGLALSDSQFVGVGGDAQMVSDSDIPALKTAQLKPGSIFVDDSEANISAAEASNKGIETYQYGAKKTIPNPNAESTVQGVLFEKMIQNLGGPGRVKGLGFDFPKGLGPAAKYFGIDPDIPTDAKRTVEGAGTIKSNVSTYLKAMKYKAGGKVDFGTGFPFPKRISNAYFKQIDKILDDQKIERAFEQNPKDERIVIDEPAVQTAADTPFNLELFKKSFSEKISRNTLFQQMGQFAKFIGLPSSDLISFLPTQVDFLKTGKGGASFSRDPSTFGTRELDGVDLTPFGFSEADNQDLYGYEKLIEEKTKQVNKVLKTPVTTFDDGSFRYDETKAEALWDEIRSLKKQYQDKVTLRRQAVIKARESRNNAATASGRGSINIEQNPFNSFARESYGTLYHEMVHQLLNSLRTKQADTFTQYKERVVSLFSGDNDDLADAFDALSNGYKSADVVYGRAYKLDGLHNAILDANRGAGDKKTDTSFIDNLSLASSKANSYTKARDFRPINPDVNKLLLASGVYKQDALDRMEDNGKEEFLTTLVQNLPKLDSTLQEVLDSTLNELLASGGITRQRFAGGSKVKVYHGSTSGVDDAALKSFKEKGALSGIAQGYGQGAGFYVFSDLITAILQAEGRAAGRFATSGDTSGKKMTLTFEEVLDPNTWDLDYEISKGPVIKWMADHYESLKDKIAPAKNTAGVIGVNKFDPQVVKETGLAYGKAAIKTETNTGSRKIIHADSGGDLREGEILGQIMNRLQTNDTSTVHSFEQGIFDQSPLPKGLALKYTGSSPLIPTDITTFANGGAVPALVSNGEAYVPPKLAKKIGYGTLGKMNMADKNGMGRFSSGGISVFKGPGSGTSDSIPTSLPVGSFIIREKATKALGLNRGGRVQRFADGGSPKGGKPNLYPGLDPKPFTFLEKMVIQAGNALSSSAAVFHDNYKIFDRLDTSWSSLARALDEYSSILINTGQITLDQKNLMYRAYEKAATSLSAKGDANEMIAAEKKWVAALDAASDSLRKDITTSAKGTSPSVGGGTPAGPSIPTGGSSTPPVSSGGSPTGPSMPTGGPAPIIPPLDLPKPNVSSSKIKETVSKTKSPIRDIDPGSLDLLHNAAKDTGMSITEFASGLIQARDIAIQSAIEQGQSTKEAALAGDQAAITFGKLSELRAVGQDPNDALRSLLASSSRVQANVQERKEILSDPAVIAAIQETNNLIANLSEQDKLTYDAMKLNERDNGESGYSGAGRALLDITPALEEVFASRRRQQDVVGYAIEQRQEKTQTPTFAAPSIAGPTNLMEVEGVNNALAQAKADAESYAQSLRDQANNIRKQKDLAVNPATLAGFEAKAQALEEKASAAEKAYGDLEKSTQDSVDWLDTEYQTAVDTMRVRAESAAKATQDVEKAMLQRAKQISAENPQLTAEEIGQKISIENVGIVAEAKTKQQEAQTAAGAATSRVDALAGIAGAGATILAEDEAQAKAKAQAEEAARPRKEAENEARRRGTEAALRTVGPGDMEDEEYRTKFKAAEKKYTGDAAKAMGLTRTRFVSKREQEAEAKRAEKEQMDKAKETEIKEETTKIESSSTENKAILLLIQALNANTLANGGNAEAVDKLNEQTSSLAASNDALASAKTENLSNKTEDKTKADGEDEPVDIPAFEDVNIPFLDTLDSWGDKVKTFGDTFAANSITATGSVGKFAGLMSGAAGQVNATIQNLGNGIRSANESFVNDTGVGKFAASFSKYGAAIGGGVTTALQYLADQEGAYDTLTGTVLQSGATIASMSTQIGVLGSQFGPLGGLLGAVAGAAIGVVQSLRNYMEAQEQAAAEALEQAKQDAVQKATADFALYLSSAQPSIEDFQSGLDNLATVINAEKEQITQGKLAVETSRNQAAYGGLVTRRKSESEISKADAAAAAANVGGATISKDLVSGLVGKGIKLDELPKMLGANVFENVKLQIAEGDAVFVKAARDAAEQLQAGTMSQQQYIDTVETAKNAAYERATSELKVKEANEEYQKSVVDVRKRLEDQGTNFLKEIIVATPKQRAEKRKDLEAAQGLMSGDMTKSRAQQQAAFQKAYRETGGTPMQKMEAAQQAASETRSRQQAAAEQILSFGDQKDQNIRNARANLLETSLKEQGIDPNEGMAKQVLDSLRQQDPELAAQEQLKQATLDAAAKAELQTIATQANTQALNANGKVNANYATQGGVALNTNAPTEQARTNLAWNAGMGTAAIGSVAGLGYLDQRYNQGRVRRGVVNRADRMLGGAPGADTTTTRGTPESASKGAKPADVEAETPKPVKSARRTKVGASAKKGAAAVGLVSGMIAFGSGLFGGGSKPPSPESEISNEEDSANLEASPEIIQLLSAIEANTRNCCMDGGNKEATYASAEAQELETRLREQGINTNEGMVKKVLDSLRTGGKPTTERQARATVVAEQPKEPVTSEEPLTLSQSLSDEVVPLFTSAGYATKEDRAASVSTIGSFVTDAVSLAGVAQQARSGNLMPGPAGKERSLGRTAERFSRAPVAETKRAIKQAGPMGAAGSLMSAYGAVQSGRAFMETGNVTDLLGAGAGALNTVGTVDRRIGAAGDILSAGRNALRLGSLQSLQEGTVLQDTLGLGSDTAQAALQTSPELAKLAAMRTSAVPASVPSAATPKPVTTIMDQLRDPNFKFELADDLAKGPAGAADEAVKGGGYLGKITKPIGDAFSKVTKAATTAVPSLGKFGAAAKTAAPMLGKVAGAAGVAFGAYSGYSADTEVTGRNKYLNTALGAITGSGTTMGDVGGQSTIGKFLGAEQGGVADTAIGNFSTLGTSTLALSSMGVPPPVAALVAAGGMVAQETAGLYGDKTKEAESKQKLQEIDTLSRQTRLVKDESGNMVRQQKSGSDIDAGLSADEANAVRAYAKVQAESKRAKEIASKTDATNPETDFETYTANQEELSKIKKSYGLEEDATSADVQAEAERRSAVAQQDLAAKARQRATGRSNTFIGSLIGSQVVDPKLQEQKMKNYLERSQAYIERDQPELFAPKEELPTPQVAAVEPKPATMKYSRAISQQAAQNTGIAGPATSGTAATQQLKQARSDALSRILERESFNLPIDEAGRLIPAVDQATSGTAATQQLSQALVSTPEPQTLTDQAGNVIPVVGPEGSGAAITGGGDYMREAAAYDAEIIAQSTPQPEPQQQNEESNWFTEAKKATLGISVPETPTAPQPTQEERMAAIPTYGLSEKEQGLVQNQEMLQMQKKKAEESGNMEEAQRIDDQIYSTSQELRSSREASVGGAGGDVMKDVRLYRQAREEARTPPSGETNNLFTNPVAEVARAQIPASQPPPAAGGNGVISNMNAAAVPEAAAGMSQLFDTAAIGESLSATFGQFVTDLQSVQLPKIPDIVTMEGKHTVEVILNGAEVLKGLEPMIKDLINQKLNNFKTTINNATEGGISGM